MKQNVILKKDIIKILCEKNVNEYKLDNKTQNVFKDIKKMKYNILKIIYVLKNVKMEKKNI